VLRAVLTARSTNCVQSGALLNAGNRGRMEMPEPTNETQGLAQGAPVPVTLQTPLERKLGCGSRFDRGFEGGRVPVAPIGVATAPTISTPTINATVPLEAMWRIRN
jgi:hypothetical protein